MNLIKKENIAIQMVVFMYKLNCTKVSLQKLLIRRTIEQKILFQTGKFVVYTEIHLSHLYLNLVNTVEVLTM